VDFAPTFNGTYITTPYIVVNENYFLVNTDDTDKTFINYFGEIYYIEENKVVINSEEFLVQNPSYVINSVIEND
jgi:hypothetical protein